MLNFFRNFAVLSCKEFHTVTCLAACSLGEHSKEHQREE